MDYELSIDPKLICRCCLAEHPSLKTIFCNEIVNGSIVPFPNVFECVTGYKASKDDGFPEKLCPACRQIINDSFVLKQKCKSNRQLLSEILKIELHDETNNDKPKAYISAAVQTIPTTSATDHIGTQTDELPQPPPKVSTQSTSMQTVTLPTETAVTQTDHLPISVKHTQTDRTRSLTECTQTSAVVTRNSDTQTDSQTPVTEAGLQFKCEALQAEDSIELEDIVDDHMEDDMHCDDVELPVNMFVTPDEHNDEPTAEDESQIVEFVLEEPNAVVDTEEDDDGATIEYLDESQLADTVADDDDQLKCTTCDSDFETYDALSEHLLNGVCSTAVSVAKKPSTRTQKSNAGPRNLRKRTASVSTVTGASTTTGAPPPLSCTLCTFSAKTDREFGLHVYGHKRWLPLLLDSAYYFRCTDCHAVYLSADELDEHWRQPQPCHRPDEDETAESCTDYQYLDDEWLDIGCEGELDLENPALLNLVQRLCSGTRTDSQHFECDRCDSFAVETAMELWLHFGDVHFRADGETASRRGDEASGAAAAMGDLEDVDPEYLESFGMVHKCGYCTKSFRTVRTAVAHVFFHAEQFNCPYESCGGVSYPRYLQLGQHLNRQHGKQRQNNETTGSFVCGFCAIEYMAYADYRSHLRLECPGRLFVCEVCDKRFYSKPHLDTHMRYHNNERRYKCQYCDKRFTQSGDQRIHERIHTGDKPFKCPFCPKTFRSIGNRKDHVATHDPTNKVTCNECGLQFKSDRILRGHMAIHSTDKRFKCPTCAKEFYRKYHLTKHLLTHSTS